MTDTIAPTAKGNGGGCGNSVAKLYCVYLLSYSFQNSEKAMSIASLPEVLCIHLKRFRFDAYFSTKIARHIRFPLSGLDMSPYLKQGHHFSHLYELNTVITHYGGAGGM